MLHARLALLENMSEVVVQHLYTDVGRKHHPL